MSLNIKVNQWVADKLIPSQHRYIILKGGGGSGKSIGVAQKIVLRMVTERNHRFLVIRQTATTLAESVFRTLKDTITDMGFASLFEFRTQPLKIINKYNGNEVLFYGMSDNGAEKIKSIKGISGVWYEEASESTKEEVLQLDLRLRDATGNYPQIILSFNPTSETLWLKEEFFDKDVDEDTLVIESTFRDNAFLTKEYKKALMGRIKNDAKAKQVYLENKWGTESQEGRFYKKFDEFKHVSKKVKYDPDKAIYMSWDFNFLPHSTTLLFQLHDDTTIHFFDEIAMKYPNNSIKSNCQEFKRRYPHHHSGLYVTGDPAGKANSAANSVNDYKIIEQELTDYSPEFYVDGGHPPQKQRGQFINDIFENNFEDITVLISPDCKILINDFSYQKEDIKGKVKPKAKDKVTGSVYEKLGHASDCFDYAMCKVFEVEWKIFQRGKTVLPYVIGYNKRSSRYL
ncbi:PBSX family phage terminase large subunit [Rufibacter ruber]|uniref:PBSX family phage terminase large subunit n=1 Tax=Rufibacter ruber TaxID=1783499 RepID=UPI00082DFF2C|nr:PBSX family phage terminase large subunit [Rufibacter ruber]